ncbi:hypothetical protein Tco_1266851, partial [Tanacetum coccineum]
LVVQENALIVQDGLGYDWSYITQDKPTEFALMAYTLNSLGSDTEVSDDDEDIFQSNDLQATDKPSFKRIEFTNARNEFVKPKQTEKPRITTQILSYSHLIKDYDFHDKRMAKKSVLKNMGKNTGQREIRPVWNSA